MRKLTASLLLYVITMFGQTANAPTWKEFSIGPGVKGNNRTSRDGIEAHQMPLKRIVSRAYGIAEHRIVGPTWISAESYALTALVNSPEDLQPLLQRELAGRFYLAAHRETRDIPVLVLKPLEGTQPLANLPSAPDKLTGPNPAIHLTTGTIADFANTLADIIERPVINETNIEGHYDIYFTWDRKGTASIPAALKQQLGIQSVEEKRPIDLLIIDHIEWPVLSN